MHFPFYSCGFLSVGGELEKIERGLGGYIKSDAHDRTWLTGPPSFSILSPDVSSGFLWQAVHCTSLVWGCSILAAPSDLTQWQNPPSIISTLLQTLLCSSMYLLIPGTRASCLFRLWETKSSWIAQACLERNVVLLPRPADGQRCRCAPPLLFTGTSFSSSCMFWRLACTVVGLVVVFPVYVILHRVPVLPSRPYPFPPPRCCCLLAAPHVHVPTGAFVSYITTSSFFSSAPDWRAAPRSLSFNSFIALSIWGSQYLLNLEVH